MDFIDIARWIIPYFLIATAFALWDGRLGWGTFGYPPERALWWPRTIALAFLSIVARWADGMRNDLEEWAAPSATQGWDVSPDGTTAVLNPLPCGGTHKRHLFLKAQFCQRGCGAVNPDWNGTAVPNPPATVIHAGNVDIRVPNSTDAHL